MTKYRQVTSIDKTNQLASKYQRLNRIVLLIAKVIVNLQITIDLTRITIQIQILGIGFAMVCYCLL